MKFGAGGRHEGRCKGVFWARRSDDGREGGRATFNAVVGCAAEACTCAVLLSPSWELWAAAVGLLTGPLLAIGFKSRQRGSMHFHQ